LHTHAHTLLLYTHRFITYILIYTIYTQTNILLPASLRLVEQKKFDVLGSGYQRPFELVSRTGQYYISI
jgi:hypothetical protein